MASSTTRTPSPRPASRKSPRRWKSSSPRWTSSRPKAPTPRSPWHRRLVGSRHHGLPEHRPQLLEGRGRPPGAARRHRQVHRPALRRHLGPAGQVGAYMPTGFEAVKYPDSQVLFTSGQAAIYPTGSWEISVSSRKLSSRWASSSPGG